MAKTITAKWTGEYPALCHGEWYITIDGITLVELEEGTDPILKEHFNTDNSYPNWGFDKDYSVQWGDYRDGLGLQAWLTSKNTLKLLALIASHGIAMSEQDKEDLYKEIQDNDFRLGSCGGCI